MADEQIILLSPEEELTSVRERLGKAKARRIKLVLPMQTQLRSHVSWKLLHARAREMGKEILVISPESQIRAVAKAAGFQVAESQGSPASGKSRPGSRPGRAGLGGKTSARLRTPPGRGEARQPDQRPSQPYNDQPSTQKPVNNRIFREDELSTGGVTSPLSSSTFGENEKHFGPEYDYSIGSSPSMRPLGTPYEDDEPDLYLEDIQMANSIREANQKNEQDSALPSDQMAPPPRYNLPSTPSDPEDPFTYMADDQPASLREQRGSVSFHEMDEQAMARRGGSWVDGRREDEERGPLWQPHSGNGEGRPAPGEHDIAEDPTDVLSIEDLGDVDDDTFHRPDASAQAWAEPTPDDEQDIPGPSRVHGVRPRTSRMSRSLPQSPLPGSEDEVAHSPVYDQPTRGSQRTSGTTPARPSGALSSSALGGPNRPPQAVSLPQPRSTQPGTTQPQKKQRPGKTGPAGKGSTGAIPARSTQKPATAQAKQRGKKMRVENIGIPVLVGMLLLLLLGLLAYLGPSADVTVTLQSRDYQLKDLSLTASATSHQDVKLHTLPAHMLTFVASATGTGHATGSSTVGTVQAKGTVFFNNTGTSQIVVPTGTVVETKGNVQFQTQAEVLALQGNNNPPTFVQAVIAGVSGNVAAGSITVIPPDSQTKILQANPGLNPPLTLTVTNTDATTGGGAGSATSVTNNDVNKEHAALDPQLKAQVQQFLAKNVGPNDQLGKMIQTDTPVSTPSAGNVVVNGNFTETVTRHIMVLVVRAADLQTAVKAQLNTTLNEQKTGLALVPQQVVQLTQFKNTPSKDGTSLALKLVATGQVAPQVSEDIVRKLVTGKSINDAKLAIKGSGGIPHVLNTDITVSPSFFRWVPFDSARIAVHFDSIKSK
ncbi:MAG: hypothetical protein NVSMB27_44560 [Ktedonobacteraceae bacterium]